jgi:hypothetical protein
VRQCVGCGEMIEKRNLVRIVKTAEEEFLIDNSGKKNGRGAYVCAKSECLNKAIKNNGLERSFKCKVPEEIKVRLKEEMTALEK